MVLKIRLARFGKRHAPFYNIVVAHARTARNSKPLEVLGTYDPIPQTPSDVAQGEKGRKFKDIKLDVDRAKYWLGVGAQPSETAWRLMSMVCSAILIRYRWWNFFEYKEEESERWNVDRLGLHGS